MGTPFASRISSNRQASTLAMNDSRGYHLNGRAISATWWPRARNAATSHSTSTSLPPSTKGTCAVQTAMRMGLFAAPLLLNMRGFLGHALGETALVAAIRRGVVDAVAQRVGQMLLVYD